MNFPTPRPPCLLFASESPLSAAACAVPLPSGPPPRTGPRSGAEAKDIQSATLPRRDPRRLMPRLAPPGRGEPPEHSAAAGGVRGSRIRRPVRSLRRHARAMACVVLGLAAVALATPAAAQSASAYERVRNVDQEPLSIVFTGRDHSQRFTTGSYSGGYSLAHVAIGTEDARYLSDFSGSPYLGADLTCAGEELFLVDTAEDSPSECTFVVDPFSVSVCRVLASGYPDRDSCTLLNPPSSFVPAGFLTFLAPEVADPNGIGVEKIELAPNTTYTLLTVAAEVEGRDASVLYGLTESDNEDTESSPGWSIWNDYDHYDSSDDSWGPDSYARAHRVQISATKGHSTAVITSVAVTAPPHHALYGTGDIIEFTVTLSGEVTVEGDPVFIFSLGGVDTAARYDAERSTAQSLVFRYTVQPGDEVTDGIWVGNGPGTFRLDEDDHIRTLRSLQDALLDHDVLGTLSDYRVAPTTVQTLVSNVRQPSGTTQSSVTGHPSLAQAFTTGSNAAGYGLYSIRVNVGVVHYEPTGPPTASIWTTNARGIPQTKLFDLTGPASIPTTGPRTFTVNTALRASTTYALVLTDVLDRFGRYGGNIAWSTASTAEDAGGAPGWSITNDLRKKIDGRWYRIRSSPLRVEFTGTILANSTDATLRGLALSDASDDSSIALRPSFASSITSYTASVAGGVDAITIAPTPTSNGARVAYLDGSNMPIPDADATKSGQQVSLAAGANTIKVQVTAEDGATMQPYTVTVTHTPASAQAQVTEAEVTEAEVIEAEATVTSTPQLTSDTYGVGETIEFTVTFSEAVEVEGAPEFIFSLGGVDTEARYDAERSTATSLVFKYEVQARDEDTDGISVGDHTQTFSPDDHILTHSQLGILTGHKVDGSSAPPPPPPQTVTVRSGGGTTGGGSGGGGGSARDEHGNTPAQATPVTLDPARTASVPGQINTAADVDYFSVDVPHAGVLVVETSGPTATVGTVWQAGAELATTDSGGTGRNFRLSVRVAPGSVVIAVAGNGQQTGAYTLQVTFLPGYLENPGAESFQSGIGVISGWVCDADEVEITLNGEPQEAAYGTARLDTETVCGDSDNGFGLLFNWNLLGDGEHEVVALVDGVELDRATVMVTTLGAEFLRDVTGTCTAADFPTMAETVTLAWQQTQQNFVIVDGPAPAGANRAGTPGVGYLENPGPNSFQSGIGVLSGWVCEGAEVIIELNGEPQPAAYGTERLDTLGACGDTANGFGLLFNWNLLGEGEHEVVAFVDDEELGRATVRVTTLSAEFVRDVEGECTVEDFPMLGETVTLEWQQNSQNFVVTDVE